MTVRGSTSETRRLPLTSDRSNLFEQNQLDTFAIVGWDIGDLAEVTYAAMGMRELLAFILSSSRIDSDRSQTATDWNIKEIVMWKMLPNDGDKLTPVYFPFNGWLGKKASRLKARGEPYSSRDQRIRGETLFRENCSRLGSMFCRTDLLSSLCENW